MNIRTLQIKAHSIMLCFSLIKRKAAFLLLIVFLIKIKTIYPYMKSFSYLIINELDALILDHQIFYYSVILLINILLIANTYIKYKTTKMEHKKQ